MDRILESCPPRRVRVVCASQEFSAREMAHGSGRWLSGSRAVWESLSVGARPDLVVIQLQAPPLGEHVLDFLFGCLPSRREDVRDRHALVDVADDRPMHLSEKVATDTELIERIARTIRVARRSGHVIEGLSCYASSISMARLARLWDIPLLDTCPELLVWGTKSGARQLFRAANIPHLEGSYHVSRGVDDLVQTLARLTRRLDSPAWMVKLDHGFGSGHGNSVVDTRTLGKPITAKTLAQASCPCSERTTTTEFLDLVEQYGCIVERRIEAAPGSALAWPSALAYLSRSSHDAPVQVEFLGVHDQLIGSTGEFHACRYPADGRYRQQVISLSGKLFARLAQLGVTGHAGVDFIAEPAVGRLWAVEINLRQTGTTHPHRTARACIRGAWRADGTAAYSNGGEVHYKATDAISSPHYVGIGSAELISALQSAPTVAFDPATGTGTIPHLWSTLAPHGKIGATFFSTSIEGCDQLETAFVQLLETLATGR
ncbi:hypothetical protein [Nocardia sp. NPDC020380]|uniref:hypothetical protein n=1 Tax=Nocardia sp. NPDC020380 TaxID=3364309 RepID=UPI0037B94785